MLILVRHGRTAHNASRRLLGRLDVPLDDLGTRQVEALGASSILSGASRVVSSPLKRALDTADALGLPVTVDERWTELDFGKYDGMEIGAVPDLWSEWTNNPAYVPEGGESLAALGIRVRAACDDLWAEAADNDVVVVSHVSPIKAAIAWALGVGDETSWRMFVDVASVSCIGPGRALGRGRSPVLRSFNDTTLRPSI